MRTTKMVWLAQLCLVSLDENILDTNCWNLLERRHLCLLTYDAKVKIMGADVDEFVDGDVCDIIEVGKHSNNCRFNRKQLLGAAVHAVAITGLMNQLWKKIEKPWIRLIPF